MANFGNPRNIRLLAQNFADFLQLPAVVLQNVVFGGRKVVFVVVLRQGFVVEGDRSIRLGEPAVWNGK